jgi:NADH dehydrogenase FAD-containing subunit
MAQPSTRILVLGAGIAGLLFTLRLSGKVARESVQITLVDESDTFTVRPRLHEFATNQRIFSRPFAQILRKTQVQFLQGRVTSLDPSQHRVMVQDQQQQHELGYDYLVYALGSLTDRHSVPGVEEYAYSLQARGSFSAEALRERLPEIGARGGQVVVCGGGATGIETAAQVASVYPQIKVSLVTHGPLALSWDKRVAGAIRRRLVSLGVEIVEQSTVRAVRTHSVVLDQGREIECSLCIWTAGFVVPPLAMDAGLSVNERDQVLVDPFLRSVSHQEIYAIGDAALPVEDPGVSHVRMSAFTASIMGAHGADCLRAILSGKTPTPLSFAYVAQAIALGRHHAIFFPLSPDDRPRPPYITGRVGALTREFFIGFVIAATLAQQRFPGMFAWPGKGRYEQAQRQKRALEEHPSLASASPPLMEERAAHAIAGAREADLPSNRLE